MAEEKALAGWRPSSAPSPPFLLLSPPHGLPRALCSWRRGLGSPPWELWGTGTGSPLHLPPGSRVELGPEITLLDSASVGQKAFNLMTSSDCQSPS